MGYACGHQHDHRFTHGASGPPWFSRKSPPIAVGTTRRTASATGGAGFREAMQVLRHRGERVIGDRVDNRDHGKTHGEAHHDGAALP